MGLLATDAIGGGLKILGAGANMIAGVKAYRDQMKNLAKQQRMVKNWHDIDRNRKITERDDNVARNEQAKQHWADAMAQAQATKSVIGGTNAQLAADKNAAALGFAAEQGQAMQRGELQRAADENAYRRNMLAIQDKMNGAVQQRANGIAASTSQAIQAGSDMLKIPNKDNLA